MSFPRARGTIATDVSILGKNSRKVILKHGNLWRSSRPTRESTGRDDDGLKIGMIAGKGEGVPGAAAISHGSLSYPSPIPFKLRGKPMPSSGVSKMMKVAVLAVRSWPRSLSSITTSATQPLGRHLTKPARPTSWLSSFRPRPEGNSTPSGATTRISLLFWSAVFSTITVRPALERSSATTLWIRAHCSPCAPGGVSQRICQSPWTDRTAPCALAEAVRPSRNATATMPPAKLTANGLPRLATLLALYFEGPIRVDPLIFPWLSVRALDCYGNHGALKAIPTHPLMQSLDASLRRVGA